MNKTVTFTGMSDASGAVALNEDYFIVAHDEDNILRIYDKNKPNDPKTIALSDVFNEIEDGDDHEIDLEGATRIGENIFWIGSHSASKNGKPRPDRHRLFAVRLKREPDAEFSATSVGKIYTSLIDDLAKISDFDVYKLNEARKIKPKAVGGLSIEGLTATPDGALLIGFRNPLVGGRVIDGFLTGGQSLVVKLLNPLDVIEGSPAKFGKPIELALGGFGIRDLEYYRAKDRFLIIAGPYHENEETAGHPREAGHLYLWSGEPEDAPQLLENIDLSEFNIEAAFFFTASETEVILLSDDGSLENNSFRSLTVDLADLS